MLMVSIIKEIIISRSFYCLKKYCNFITGRETFTDNVDTRTDGYFFQLGTYHRPLLHHQGHASQPIHWKRRQCLRNIQDKLFQTQTRYQFVLSVLLFLSFSFHVLVPFFPFLPAFSLCELSFFFVFLFCNFFFQLFFFCSFSCSSSIASGSLSHTKYPIAV